MLQLQERLKTLEQPHVANKSANLTLQIRQIKQEIDKILSEEVEKKYTVHETEILRGRDPKQVNS